jgi:hypothetical protein
MWHTLPSFMKIGIGVQAKLKFCLSNLKNYDVGITDEKDLYPYQVACRLVQAFK